MAYGTRSSMPLHKSSPIIPILSRINPIPRIDTYLLKVYSNIVLPSTGLFPVGLPVKILKALLSSSILLITLTILGERYKL